MAHGTDISYWFAFVAGLLSFFSPCVLPLVPAYLANLAGNSAIDVGEQRKILPTLLHSIAFVIGFSLIYILLGAFAGIISPLLAENARLIQQISGLIIAIFGIFLIISPWVPWLNYEKRFHFRGARNPNIIRSLLIGSAFAFGWTPCIGPILGSILTYSLNSKDVWGSMILLSFYSLGLGIPFIIIGLAWGYVMPFWKTMNKHTRTISIISGIFLIILGILMSFGQLAWLSQFSF